MAQAKKQVYRYSQRLVDGIPQQVFIDLLAEIDTYNAEWLADASGVHITTLYHWLEGRVRSPRLLTMLKVARAIGYDIQLVKTGKNRSHLKLV